MKPWGVRTPGLVAGARKDLRVRPFPSAEWRPRGSRGTECGPEKCSSANQVNGAQIHPTVSFLSLACFPYLFFFFFSFFVSPSSYNVTEGRMQETKKSDDNYVT